MKKQAKKLVFATILAVAAMTLPSESHATKICDEEYYYDAAHTQWAGYCWKRCFPSPEYNCMGEVTLYSALVNCSPSCES
jgi:hypothetical protein